MDLQPTEETFSVADYTWLRSIHAVDTGQTTTIALADMDEDTHYPEGVLLSGLLLAQYTTGVNDGLWGVYSPGQSDGRQNAGRVLLDAVPVNKNADGSLSATKVAASALLPIGLLLDVSNMPGVLDNTPAAHAIVAADLPTGMTTV